MPEEEGVRPFGVKVGGRCDRDKASTCFGFISCDLHFDTVLHILYLDVYDTYVLAGISFYLKINLVIQVILFLVLILTQNRHTQSSNGIEQFTS